LPGGRYELFIEADGSMSLKGNGGRYRTSKDHGVTWVEELGAVNDRVSTALATAARVPATTSPESRPATSRSASPGPILDTEVEIHFGRPSARAAMRVSEFLSDTFPELRIRLKEVGKITSDHNGLIHALVCRSQDEVSGRFDALLDRVVEALNSPQAGWRPQGGQVQAGKSRTLGVGGSAYQDRTASLCEGLNFDVVLKVQVGAGPVKR
jgi:hypothetical protein